jgi:hypothetical protein
VRDGDPREGANSGGAPFAFNGDLFPVAIGPEVAGAQPVLHELGRDAEHQGRFPHNQERATLMSQGALHFLMVVQDFRHRWPPAPWRLGAEAGRGLSVTSFLGAGMMAHVEDQRLARWCGSAGQLHKG